MLKAAKKMNKYRFPKNKYASSIPTNITIEIQIEIVKLIELIK